jgi:hypothetical protein
MDFSLNVRIQSILLRAGDFGCFVFNFFNLEICEWLGRSRPWCEVTIVFLIGLSVTGPLFFKINVDLFLLFPYHTIRTCCGHDTEFNWHIIRRNMAKPIPTPLALLQVDNDWILAPILALTAGAVLREDPKISSVSLLMEACLQSRLACTSADCGLFRGGWLIDLWITSRYYDGASIPRQRSAGVEPPKS